MDISKLKQLVETSIGQHNMTEVFCKLSDAVVYVGDQAKNVDYTTAGKVAVEYTAQQAWEHP